VFRFTRTSIEPQTLRARLADPACGGYAAFEGWVRDSHEGVRVRHLEYEAFEALAVREGERIPRRGDRALWGGARRVPATASEIWRSVNWRCGWE